jgi:hypothetical protein
MTDEQHDPQPEEQIAARDAKLILDAINTGVTTVGLGYAIYKGHGDREPPPPPAPPPEEPSQTETTPMPGFNE